MALLLCLQVLLIISVSLSQTIDLSNWMKIKSNILWNKTLSQLTILGTHDSGSYNLTHTMMPGGEPEFLLELIQIAEELHLPIDEVITLWSRSQPFNLYDQLLNGIRYFDMRCGFWGKQMNWYTYHGQIGQLIQYLSSNIIQFLNQHNEEIVLIEANGLTGSNLNNSDVEMLANLFNQWFGDYLYPRRNNTNDRFPTYGEMIESNHRILISIGYNNKIIEPFNNIWFGNTFENTYGNTDNLTKMQSFNNKQVELFNNNETNKNALFKISWTLTPNGDTILRSVKIGEPHDLIQLANIANKQMWNWTESKIMNQNLRIGNVFIFDDYLTASTEDIINALY